MKFLTCSRFASQTHIGVGLEVVLFETHTDKLPQLPAEEEITQVRQPLKSGIDQYRSTNTDAFSTSTKY